VWCQNPGDAASPVYLQLGGYVRQIGQSADYRHDVTRAAVVHEAVEVCGYWEEDGWHVSIDLDEAVCREIAARAGTRTDQQEIQSRAAARQRMIARMDWPTSSSPVVRLTPSQIESNRREARSLDRSRNLDVPLGFYRARLGGDESQWPDHVREHVAGLRMVYA